MARRFSTVVVFVVLVLLPGVWAAAQPSSMSTPWVHQRLKSPWSMTAQDADRASTGPGDEIDPEAFEQVHPEMMVPHTANPPCCRNPDYDCHAACRPCPSQPVPSGFYSGFEAVIAKPFFNSSQVTNFQVPGQALRWPLEFTPRVWLGYVGQRGAGFRVRYWQFDKVSNPATAVDPISATPALFNSTLALHSLDAEATQRVQFGPLTLNFAAGGRYASLTYTRYGHFLDPLGVAPPLEDRQQFQTNAGGPTLAIEAFRPCCGRLSFYGSARGSLLFGMGVFRQDDRIALSSTHLRLRQDTILPNSEFQLGLQWISNPRNPLRLLARTGIEAQLWNNAGNFLISNVNDSSLNQQRLGNIGFFGITTTVGLVF